MRILSNLVSCWGDAGPESMGVKAVGGEVHDACSLNTAASGRSRPWQPALCTISEDKTIRAPKVESRDKVPPKPVKTSRSKINLQTSSYEDYLRPQILSAGIVSLSPTTIVI